MSCRVAAHVLLLIGTAVAASAQTAGALQGRVFDASGAVLPNASVRLRNTAESFVIDVSTDAEGRYQIHAGPAGSYQATAAADGFRPEVIEALTFEVGRTLVRDFRLNIGGQSEAVTITAELPLLDRATSTVGHVVSPQTVRGIPLNGRHFVDI